MKTKLIKFTSVVVLIILMVSCFPNKGRKLYPETPANPYFLTSEAQTVNIKIKNVTRIEPYKSQKDDKITIKDGPPYSLRIENEWITIYFEDWNTHNNYLNISLKENLSDVARSYNLFLYSEVHQIIFTITQKGKSK